MFSVRYSVSLVTGLGTAGFVLRKLIGKQSNNLIVKNKWKIRKAILILFQDW